MKTEAEIRETREQSRSTKDCQQHQKLREPRDSSLLRASRNMNPARTLTPTLAPRTGREHLSVSSGHQVCSDWFGSLGN